ncbi:MAG: adenine-specific methyltransferase EcoRI family protein, partial [Treponema sp.]|nr:adenine-specific methyltransferase EcoRI family protein [Treponema sp.]
PFSLLREFMAWIMEAKKQFLIIGNINAITYKEIFPLLKENKVWLGNNYMVNGGAMFYEIPENIANLEQVREIKTNTKGKKIYITRVQGVRWFTNLDHGRRHQPISFMTMADNLKYSKHKEIKGKKTYNKYVNYDAIEVPFVDAIPSDYDGLMGVPVSILDKYCPDQFEILGTNLTLGKPISEIAKKGTYAQGGPSFYIKNSNKTYDRIYTRIIIKHKRGLK